MPTIFASINMLPERGAVAGRGKERNGLRVVDLFAGPGGLGEGFSSFTNTRGEHPFRIALSIEKDAVAHQTLQLRSFYRQFVGRRRVPEDYWQHLRGKLDREALFRAHPAEAMAANREALAFELGPENHSALARLLKEQALDPEHTIVIGGPPCQAYSVAGRSRNGAIAGWSLEKDGRSTLYKEYLQVLAEAQPAAFIMENVRGLLSARMNGAPVIDRILDDLRQPRVAVGHSTRGTKYRLVPLDPSSSDGELPLGPRGVVPADFLLRAEQHGVPQSRQRVIIMGLREDLFPESSKDAQLARDETELTVRYAIQKLPKLRCGISGEPDDRELTLEAMWHATKARWFKNVPSEVRGAMEAGIDRAGEKEWTRGGAFVPSRAAESEAGGFMNHETRGHMVTDIHRYLFAAAWAEVEGVSPTLRDFPVGLLPDHGNVELALTGGQFADRFRVQCWGGPSTTVVSHISKDGHYYIHPDAAQCRSLTVREAARLQTFPDDYLFCGPRTSQFQQVGNAVPVELARRIAGALYRSIGSP